MREKPLFFIIAGEASGDLLGAGLMRGLKKLMNDKVRFVGIGGARMKAEGLDVFLSEPELAHVGIFEVLAHLPKLMGLIRRTVDEVKQQQPVALITIDSPDFNFRVAKRLKKEKPDLPLIHYVAPTVWAWRPGRARKIAAFLDHLLTLLPFEPPYFTREGLPTTFVGHPIVESGAGQGDGARFRAQHNVPADTPVLAVLPGSRISEINRLMPVFQATVERLARTNPRLTVVMPTVETVEETVKQKTCDWPVTVIVTLMDQAKYDAFAAATAALACSGTISIELAMARLPAVIAYKINPLTAFLLRRLIVTKYATLINIMQDRMIMPEFLQENCTPDKLAEAVHALLNDPAARQRQQHELDAIAVWLGQGKFVPSERAARVVLEVVSHGARRQSS